MLHRYIVNRLQSHLCAANLIGALASIVLAVAFGNAMAASDSALAVEAVSNRADLVSGGDVLVRVTLPSNVGGNQAVLSLNGQPLSNPLHAAPDGRGYLALVTGLNQGHNTLTLAAGGGFAGCINHQIESRLALRPHLQPWSCTTQSADPRCSQTPSETHPRTRAS